MESVFVFAQVTEACGTDPGLLCWIVFKATASEQPAQASEWIAGPSSAVIILTFTWLATTVLRRFLSRTVDREIVGQQRGAAQGVAEAEQRASSEDRAPVCSSGR